MADLNLTVIEGRIAGKFHIQDDIPGKEVSAINFVIVNQNDKGKEFKYAAVAWRSDPDKFLSSFEDGDFVRVTGHNQSTPMTSAEGKIAFLSKICADKVELLGRA